jgi:hypothetical protein
MTSTGISLAILLGMLGASAQSDSTESVDCSAFRQNADGSWAVLRQTTVKFGNATVSLGPTTLRRNAISVGGTDVVSVVEKACGITRL